MGLRLFVEQRVNAASATSGLVALECAIIRDNSNLNFLTSTVSGPWGGSLEGGGGEIYQFSHFVTGYCTSPCQLTFSHGNNRSNRFRPTCGLRRVLENEGVILSVIYMTPLNEIIQSCGVSCDQYAGGIQQYILLNKSPDASISTLVQYLNAMVK